MNTEVVVANPSVQTLMRPIGTPKDLLQYHEDMTCIIRDALIDGTDYGVIPNTKKPTLYKAGAERINIAFGTHSEYELVDKEIDHDRKCEYNDRYKGRATSYGLYRYVYKCRIVKADGRVIGEGEGVCSTLEAKYISRPRDSENTACKMAQKRAFLAATLHAFGLSDRFTQDMEDSHEEKGNKNREEAGANQNGSNNLHQQNQSNAQVKPPPVLFDNTDPKHLDALVKKLIDLKVPEDKHDAIAVAFHGKYFAEQILTDIVASHHQAEVL